MLHSLRGRFSRRWYLIRPASHMPLAEMMIALLRISLSAFERSTSAIRLALQLLRSPSPHVLVVGHRGTAFLAEALGVPPGETLHVDAQCEYNAWLKKEFPGGLIGTPREIFLRATQGTVQDTNRAQPTDTVGVLYRRKGSIWAGVSTSGWDYKIPGRVGDSAVYGAGIVADSRVGAVICTHFGELAIRTQAAGRVLFHLEAGRSPAEAVEALAAHIRSRPSLPKGPLVVHVLPRSGAPECFALGGLAGPTKFFVWANGAGVEERECQPVSLA